MSLPSSTRSNIPQGLLTVTIATVEYKVTAMAAVSVKPTRNIVRTDENGDYYDTMVRPSAEPVTVQLTLMRLTTTTTVPDAGDTFSADLYRAGSTQTWIVTSPAVQRATDAADTFTIEALLSA